MNPSMKIEKGTTFKVLDHGYVTLLDWMGEDADIVRAARMSTGKGFEGWEPTERCKSCRILKTEAELPGPCPPNFAHVWETTKGDGWLLEYLLSEKHTTPFEMCELKMEIQAPLMVFREWHRHRTQSYSEYSARYSQMQNLHYLPDPSRIQKQGLTNKQGSAEAFDEDFAKEVIRTLGNEQDNVYGYYDFLVKKGVAKEIARLDTPVSRYSKMVAKTDLWNWLAFLNLRHPGNAQFEIRQYAYVISDIIKTLFPKTHHLWEEHMRYAVRFSRREHSFLIAMLKEVPAFQEKLALSAASTLGAEKGKKFMNKLMKERE